MGKEISKAFLFIRVTQKTYSKKVQEQYAKRLHIPCLGKNRKADICEETKAHIMHMPHGSANTNMMIVYDPWVLGDNWNEIRQMVKWFHENEYVLQIATLKYRDFRGRDYDVFMRVTSYMAQSNHVPGKKSSGPHPITLNDYSDNIKAAFRRYCTDHTVQMSSLRKAFEQEGVHIPSNKTMLRLIFDMDTLLLNEHREDKAFSIFRSKLSRSKRGLPITSADLDSEQLGKDGV